MPSTSIGINPDYILTPIDVYHPPTKPFIKEPQAKKTDVKKISYQN
jgi:hypothetical protein